MKRAANPSPIKVAATSTPLTRSVPQRRPKLHASVPSVPGAQEHAICWKSERPLLTSSRSRRLAASPFWRSASHRARLPVSGALKPTRRTFGRPSSRLMVSPSMTRTEIDVGAETTDLAGVVATFSSLESFGRSLNGHETNQSAKYDYARKVTRTTRLQFEALGLKPFRVGPFGFAKSVDIVGHAR